MSSVARFKNKSQSDTELGNELYQKLASAIVNKVREKYELDLEKF